MPLTLNFFYSKKSSQKNEADQKFLMSLQSIPHMDFPGEQCYLLTPQPLGE